MKNNNDHEIKQGRSQKLHRTLPTDILVLPEVIEQNRAKQNAQPRRKRRIDYAKKIMNDEFLMRV